MRRRGINAQRFSSVCHPGHPTNCSFVKPFKGFTLPTMLTLSARAKPEQPNSLDLTFRPASSIAGGVEPLRGSTCRVFCASRRLIFRVVRRRRRDASARRQSARVRRFSSPRRRPLSSPARLSLSMAAMQSAERGTRARLTFSSRRFAANVERLSADADDSHGQRTPCVSAHRIGARRHRRPRPHIRDCRK